MIAGGLLKHCIVLRLESMFGPGYLHGVYCVPGIINEVVLYLLLTIMGALYAAHQVIGKSRGGEEKGHDRGEYVTHFVLPDVFGAWSENFLRPCSEYSKLRASLRVAKIRASYVSIASRVQRFNTLT